MKSGSAVKSGWFCEVKKFANGHSSPGLHRACDSTPLFCCNRTKADSQVEDDFPNRSKDSLVEGAITINFNKQEKQTSDDATNLLRQNTPTLCTKNSNASPKLPTNHHSALPNSSLSVPNLLIYNPSLNSRLK